MAERDPDELVVAGTGDIYVADVGTALPANESTVLNGAFVKVGYTTEDGVTFKRTPEIAEFNAWQSRTPVRRELTAQEIMLSTVFEQWNAENLVFAFGGGEVTEESSGHYKFSFPADDAQLEEKSLICDWADGAKDYRLVIPRGSVTEEAETNLVRTELAVLPFGFKALAPTDGSVTAYILSNDPAFNPAGS